jgi:DNA-binding NarL/FixJ family response regulator
LVEEAVSAARDSGFAVGQGAAEPGDVAVELAVLMDALFGGSEPLLERSALEDFHASREQRYWMLQDIQALLEQAALRQPILICLDDLQWADSGTRAAILTLPTRLAGLPVGWVLAFRPLYEGSDLGRIAAGLLRNGADKTVLGRVPGIERHAAWLLALQAQADGDPAQAHRRLTALGEKERLSLFPLFPLDPADDPQLVRIALASEDQELAESAASGAEERAEINPGVPALLASAVHARGLLTGDPSLLAQAVTILEAGRRRLALASALEDLAVAELRAGRSDEAIAALDRALAIYADCGARWDLARVRRRLRQLGVQRRLPAERRPTRGWAALTESELAVVRLVTEGFTNREVAERLYVSPNTVSSHLRRAFEKLGINSRVALTRIAAEHAEPA